MMRMPTLSDRDSRPADGRRVERDHLARMGHFASLCWSFPGLHDAPGIEPWQPAELDAWALGPNRTAGSRHAAAFVLALWAPAPWRVGPFDAIEAMKVWDETERAAFAAWARDPWWP